jgi:hypothetical protein
VPRLVLSWPTLPQSRPDVGLSALGLGGLRRGDAPATGAQLVGDVGAMSTFSGQVGGPPQDPRHVDKVSCCRWQALRTRG